MLFAAELQEFRPLLPAPMLQQMEDARSLERAIKAREKHEKDARKTAKAKPVDEVGIGAKMSPSKVSPKAVASQRGKAAPRAVKAAAGHDLEEAWTRLVEDSALADGRSNSNIRSMYIGRPTVTLQLAALGRVNAREILSLCSGSPSAQDRVTVSKMVATALCSDLLQGKAGPKAALSAISNIHGAGTPNTRLPKKQKKS